MTAAADLVLIGRVIRAHGVQGELTVRPYSGRPDTFLHCRRLLLAAPGDPAPVAYGIVRVRVQRSDRLIVAVEGCATRDAAERLVRASVHVPASELPALNAGEYYLRDVEGKRMQTEDGRLIGRIVAVLTGSQDLAQVEQDGKEYLIPLVPAFLVAVTEDAVTVSLPPGLLEINA